MRHHGKTPLGDSNMCKKCLLEAKRHHTNTTYIPKWQKTTLIPKPNHKCIHPRCKASEKLIHASFEHIEKLESALGVTSSPDNPFLLCRDHYNKMYRKFHPQTLCASCGAIYPHNIHLIPEVAPHYNSNAEEADIRVWRHAVQSRSDRVLIYSPDTDVYNIGLGLLQDTTKQFIVQLNVPHSAQLYGIYT